MFAPESHRGGYDCVFVQRLPDAQRVFYCSRLAHGWQVNQFHDEEAGATVGIDDMTLETILLAWYDPSDRTRRLTNRQTELAAADEVG